MEKETRIRLYHTLAEHFDKGELRTLCFHLGVDYDELPGERTTDKARELIAYLERRRSLSRLIEVGKKLRPDISWQDTPGATTIRQPSLRSSFENIWHRRYTKSSRMTFVLLLTVLLLSLLLSIILLGARLRLAPESGDKVQVGNNSGVVIGPGSVVSGNIGVYPQPVLPTKDPRLYDVKIEGQNNEVIVAYNKSREVIWQDKLDTKIQSILVADVNNDGNQEALAATSEPGDNPGWLYVYNYTGDQIAKQNLWRQSIYYGGSKPKVNVHDIKVTDLTNDGIKEIIAIAGDAYWYASRISVLQLNATKLSEIATYWNPGQLKKLYVADMNGDGIQDIVCIGENNDLQSIYPLSGNVFVAFLLDGARISGQAPPSFGNAPKGSEVWYAYLTPSSTSISEADFEDLNHDGKNDVQISFSDSCSSYLDYSGKVVGQGSGSNCEGKSALHILRR